MKASKYRKISLRNNGMTYKVKGEECHNFQKKILREKLEVFPNHWSSLY